MKRIVLLVIGFAFLLSVVFAIALKPTTVMPVTNSLAQLPDSTSKVTLPILAPAATSFTLSSVTTVAQTSQMQKETPPNVAGSENQLAGVNSAAVFNNLPSEMQREIKQLSGRDNPNAKPIEVKPGVFLLPAGVGPQVVPVAVMNDDGTVSLYEY